MLYVTVTQQKEGLFAPISKQLLHVAEQLIAVVGAVFVTSMWFVVFWGAAIARVPKEMLFIGHALEWFVFLLDCAGFVWSVGWHLFQMGKHIFLMRLLRAARESISNPDGRAVQAAGQKRMGELLNEQLDEIRKMPEAAERKTAIASLRMREWVCLRGTFTLGDANSRTRGSQTLALITPPSKTTIFGGFFAFIFY